MTTTDNNNAPETYELPPEPPIGSRVRDHSGREWVRDASIGWKSEDESRVTVAGGWAPLMGHHGPLTRIPDPEPDPWPTAPLIVATFLDKRCVFGLTDVGSYDSPTGGLEAYSEHGHTQLANVVPVTVVPTAEWEALVEAMRQWDEGGFAPITSKVRAILAAADALGVDQ